MGEAGTSVTLEEVVDRGAARAEHDLPMPAAARQLGKHVGRPPVAEPPPHGAAGDARGFDLAG
jgi:hypothetical protein